MIKRRLTAKVLDHLGKKEISLIVGPRQAGKTTLMLFIKDYLDQRGEKTLFLNFDIESDREFFESQEKLLRKIRLELGTGRGYVFLDEIQRKEDAGIFLKGLYDMNLPYKFIASGSGSAELKEKIHESLAGRKRIFELGAISFNEFVDFKTGYKYEKKLADFFKIEKKKTDSLLLEFLNFGGYPRVVLEEREEEKFEAIREIYQSYLEKDIALLLGIKKSDDFTRLVKIMASQIGSLLNVSELSVPTIKNYLWYLEKTYIIRRATPYYKNVRKEITKAPVYYFCDLGLRNYASGDFGKVNLEGNAGFLFGNFVFNLLKEGVVGKMVSVNFWRTTDGAEVDFVIDDGKKPIPVEAKFKRMKEAKITRSLRSFLEKYKPLEALVVNLSFSGEMRIKNSRVKFIRYTELMGNLRCLVG